MAGGVDPIIKVEKPWQRIPQKTSVPALDGFRIFHLRVRSDPVGDIIVRGARSDDFLERTGIDFREPEKCLIDRTIEMVAAGAVRETGATFVDSSGCNDVIAQAHAWAARSDPGEIRSEIKKRLFHGLSHRSIEDRSVEGTHKSR
jgi:hypothetical protein